MQRGKLEAMMSQRVELKIGLEIPGLVVQRVSQ